jgi:hypothetical protein
MVLLFLAGGAFPARADFLDPKIVLHLVEGAGLPADCSGAPSNLACNNQGFPEAGNQVVAQTDGDLETDYRLYVLLGDVDPAQGVSEIRFAIDYENGVSVSDWMSCAPEIVTGGTWPASGSEVTLRFNGPGGCARPAPDPGDIDGRGVVPLMVLSVRSTADALLRIVATAQGDIPLTNCSAITSPVSQDFGFGEIGFGFKIGWDPCNYNPFAHGCAVFFPCTCCLGPSCRPIAPYYDIRACINDGGTVLFIGTSDCTECAIPVEMETWGDVKTRFR